MLHVRRDKKISVYKKTDIIQGGCCETDTSSLWEVVVNNKETQKIRLNLGISTFKHVFIKVYMI